VRRLFWLALGASAGVVAVRRLTRTAAALTPRGLADSVADLGASIRVFAEEVRAGMAERELELREALGLEDPNDAGQGPPPEPDQAAAAAARREHRIEHPFGDR